MCFRPLQVLLKAGTDDLEFLQGKLKRLVYPGSYPERILRWKKDQFDKEASGTYPTLQISNEDK